MALQPGLLALQERLQHPFAKPALLERAVTHRSFSADHNERLEFLGDSVLSLAVASLLYARLSAQPEGDLSRIRANMVKQDTLHQLALGLQVADVLRLGEGESRSGGHKRPSILADALEALIGAVYLDAGYGPAEAAKTALQEWLQGRKMKVPDYRVVATAGAAHRQTFEVECHIAEMALTQRGTGNSRRAGEQAAATTMLATLKAKKT